MPTRRKRTVSRTRGMQTARKFRRVWNIALVEGAKLAEKAPDLSNAQFRRHLKNTIDEVFDLPPIAEEISDVVIAIVVDSIAWRIRETKSDFVVVERKWLTYAKECVAWAEKARGE